ncbi:MAG: hybrid sensor histidine kinase/response regulator [Cyanobacteriota bacterium]|nr:hybrid sensor histidine kinase/response regulator [Cyanobacteriota bacterium]
MNFKTKNQRILSVDDNADNLVLIELALEEEGYEVFSVDNGKKALCEVEQEPPDLILLDVMMPEIDGYEVARKIRENRQLPFIPILMVTADEQSSVVEGLDAGADEFIRKPFNIDELQARVRSLLRLKQSIEQRESFIHCLTHDLRTPLLAVDRMLNLIEQGAFGEIPKTTQEAISNIANSNQNLLSMLNRLLTVYSYDIGKKILSFIDFSLPELVEEVIQELTPLAKDKGIDLRANIAENIGKISADRLEIRRVLTNLIGNALKFTDAGFVELNIMQKSDWITIEVKDSGIGISSADQVKIFERFQQGQHFRSGSGLGLYLCYQVVQSHHGKIDVHSEVEKGTTFTVYLPQHQ